MDYIEWFSSGKSEEKIHIFWGKSGKATFLTERYCD